MRLPLIKYRKKPGKEISHTDNGKIRMTLIENPEKAKELEKEFQSSKNIIIKVGEYLGTDDPMLKDFEIALLDFVPVLDHARNEVMYVKVKPEDKMVIYHLTEHPESLKALHDISQDARKKGFAMVDSRVHIQQSADIFKTKLTGTLNIKPERKREEKNRKDEGGS